MNENTNKPLGFGEILDQTFRIIKTRFKTLFMITFLIMVPVLAIQALILSLSGRSFFTSVESGQNILDQLISGADAVSTTTIQEDLLTILANFFLIIAMPLIAGAIIWTVKVTRESETIPVTKDMIKRALSRYWPMFWSTLLWCLILVGLLVPVFMVIGFSAISFVLNPIFGAILMFLLSIGAFIGIGLLMTRWSLYLPVVLFEQAAPGLSKSWQLTKRQTWKFFGLIIILSIITGIVTAILQLPLIFLGNSVLFHLLNNIISLITSIVLFVGYAVMYFDSTTRQEATDLKEMISEYQVTDPS
ncbi:integral membrane protein [Gracilibacillus boraciitolerans JCM 21714]|uniref:Integral membrane protein n=1 Tax=Gracilibacillus boraciitolerans JCM 21714 TaxID=1298598 RepID=W4VQF0_9BACI|nr:glycerophosphoryl diester phosphodiesterase membrane domain-containing protein [Gracilibacillus boraciitolerans]GAE94979.1 integral membrane protein [Gracilibacillus boraciitolerans JCM 21714]